MTNDLETMTLEELRAELDTLYNERKAAFAIGQTMRVSNIDNTLFKVRALITKREKSVKVDKVEADSDQPKLF